MCTTEVQSHMTQSIMGILVSLDEVQLACSYSALASK